MKKQVLTLLMALVMVVTLAFTACGSLRIPVPNITIPIPNITIPLPSPNTTTGGGGAGHTGNTRNTRNTGNRQETFVFNSLPRNVNELRAMPEAAMSNPFMTAALTVAVLCAYGENPAACIEMLNVLKGPQPLSGYEIQFMRDRLTDKTYKPFSFFAGTSPQNDYTPTRPYTITIIETPHSFQEQNYATLYIRSGGADSPRPVKLRQRPSTGQWFLIDQLLLADIRIPAADDPWW